MCETHYIDTALHNPLGPVNTAASVQLDMCIPNFGIQELSMVPPAMTDIFPTQCRVEAGHLMPADVPGIGIAFNAAAAPQVITISPAVKSSPVSAWRLPATACRVSG